MKLNDLKDLKVIKKNLAPEPEKPAGTVPRKRTVVLKSKEEEHARNEGRKLRAAIPGRRTKVVEEPLHWEDP